MIKNSLKQFSNSITFIWNIPLRLQEMVNDDSLERIKKKWWDSISVRDTCEELNEETDGISIKNIGKFQYSPSSYRKPETSVFFRGYVFFIIIQNFTDLISSRWCISSNISWNWLGNIYSDSGIFLVPIRA